SLLAAALLLVTAPPAWCQTVVATWIGPAEGDWEDPANWSTGVVPGELPAGFNEAVTVDGSGVEAAVSLTSDREVRDLAITDGDELTIGPNGSLAVTDFVSVAGRAHVNGGRLSFTESSTISAGGELRISGTQAEARLGDGDGSGVINNDGLIAGAGALFVDGLLRNRGEILAEASAGYSPANAQLDLSLRDPSFDFSFPTPIVQNTGRIAATTGARLRIATESPGVASIVNEAPGSVGRIEASPGSTVEIERVYLVGGQLAALSEPGLEGGRVTLVSTTLDGVGVSGDVAFRGLTLRGVVSNTGSLAFDVGLSASSFGDDIFIDDRVTLSGGGELVLGDPNSAGATTAVRLMNFSPERLLQLVNEDNTIRGAGSIDVPLINRGVVQAGYGSGDAASTRLRLGVPGTSRSPLTNAGSLEAAGGTLEISSFDLQNRESTAQGTIRARAGGVVELNNVFLSGGTLRADAAEGETTAGAVEISGGTLADVTIEGVVGSETSTIDLSGNVRNTGTLRTRVFSFSENVTLTGGGVVELSPSSTIEIGGSFGEPIYLTNRDNTLRFHDTSVFTSSATPFLVNHGAIEVMPLASADLAPLSIISSGNITAGTDSRVELGPLVFESPTAVLRAERGSNVLVESFSGGVIEAADPMEVDPALGVVTVDNQLENTMIRGGVALDSGGGLGGQLVNDGVIYASGQRIGSSSTLLSLDGTGELKLGVTDFALTPDFFGLVKTQVINGPQHTIRGRSAIQLDSVQFINEGAIIADNGTLRVNIAGRSAFVQRGVLSTGSDGNLQIDGFGALFGDTLRLQNEGRIEALSGPVEIELPLVNRQGAEIVVNSRLEAESIENLAGGTVTGGGVLSASGFGFPAVTNAGTFAPGDGVGTLIVDADFMQSETGVLAIDVDGFVSAGPNDPDSQHDVLWLAQATLGGEVRFLFDEGLDPQFGDRVEFLFASAVTGEFDTVTGLPDLGGGLGWSLVYGQTSVAAVVTSSDANQDNAVDAADYALLR
ncbi:MAG: hypothetical protein AAF596_08715, partial [Planctomycetota bacterium]